MRVTSITPMRDEGPFILEWVAHHRLIGINDIIVFSNNCRDGTDLILERLDEMGLIRHLPNPSMLTGDTRHHLQIIGYMNTSSRLKRSDWVFSLDADEYLCIRAGHGLLEDLFNAAPNADLISVNQLNFGSSGQRKHVDGLQMRGYTKSQAYDGMWRNRIDRRGVKTLSHRRAKPTRYANHSPVFDAGLPEDGTWVNGSGTPIKTRPEKGGQIKSLTAPEYGYDLVQLNHYAIRSAENFLVQRDRGNANHDDRSADMKYWMRYDVNQVENLEIQRRADEVEGQIAEWCKDAELGQLHAKSVAYHQDWIARLREVPENRALFMKCARWHYRTWVKPQKSDSEEAA